LGQPQKSVVNGTKSGAGPHHSIRFDRDYELATFSDFCKLRGSGTTEDFSAEARKIESRRATSSHRLVGIGKMTVPGGLPAIRLQLENRVMYGSATIQP